MPKYQPPVFPLGVDTRHGVFDGDGEWGCGKLISGNADMPASWSVLPNVFEGGPVVFCGGACRREQSEMWRYVHGILVSKDVA